VFYPTRLWRIEEDSLRMITRRSSPLSHSPVLTSPPTALHRQRVKAHSCREHMSRFGLSSHRCASEDCARPSPLPSFLHISSLHYSIVKGIFSTDS
ncbi:hypothetical protein PENTCL1PPCAC_597, partial [Pristionchus entomophagus]